MKSDSIYRHSSFLVAATGCLVFASLALPFFFWLKNGVHALLLGLLLVLCILPWYLWRREPNICAPIYATSVYLLLAYPLRAILLLVFPNYSVSFFPPPYDASLVTMSLLYCVAGMCVYLITYYHFPKPLIPTFKKLSLQTSVENWPAKICVVYASGWIVRLYQIATGNYR